MSESKYLEITLTKKTHSLVPWPSPYRLLAGTTALALINPDFTLKDLTEQSDIVLLLEFKNGQRGGHGRCRRQGGA